jgi:hypothetical protein
MAILAGASAEGAVGTSFMVINGLVQAQVEFAPNPTALDSFDRREPTLRLGFS